MKKAKKIVALLLAFVLCLGLTTTAMAAETDVAGTYEYTDSTGFFPVTYTLTLEEDGTCTLIDTPSIPALPAKTYTGTYNVLPDGNVLTSEFNVEDQAAQRDWFKPGVQAVWTLDGDKCTPEKFEPKFPGGDIVGPGGDSDVPGGDDQDAPSTDGPVTVEYTDGLTMDVYLPADYDGSKNYPLLVTTAGGAFFGVSSAKFDPFCAEYADAGYIAANVIYTTGDGNFPQGVVDAKVAVQYLVDNYAVDVDNITLMGESAGAYIATMAAISGPSDFKADGAQDYTYDVKNLVDLYGPMYDDGRLSAYWGDATTGTTPDDFLESGNTDLRIWIQHGTEDANVPYETNSVALANKLKAAGFDVTFELVEGDGHADAAVTIWSDENQAEVKAWIEGAAEDEGVVGTYTYVAEKTMIDGATIKETWTLTLDENGVFGAINDNDFMVMEIIGTYTVDANGNVKLTVTSTTVNGEPATDAQKGLLPVEIVGADGKGATITLKGDTFAPAKVDTTTDSGKKEESDKKPGATAPNTDDTTPYAMYIVIAAAVVAAAGAGVARRRQAVR